MRRTSKPPSLPIREAHAARETALARARAIDALELDSPDGRFARWQARTVVELAETQLDVASRRWQPPKQRPVPQQPRRRQRFNVATTPRQICRTRPAICQNSSPRRTTSGRTSARHKPPPRRLAVTIAPAGVDVSTMEGFLAAQQRSGATHRNAPTRLHRSSTTEQPTSARRAAISSASATH